MTVPTTPKKKRNCTTRNRPSGLTYKKDRIKTVRPKLGHCKKTVEKLEAWSPIMDQILLKVWTSADNKLHPDEFMTMKELEAKHGQDARQNFCNYFSRRTKHSEIKAAKHRENLDKGYLNQVLYNKLMKHCMGSEYTLKFNMYADVKRRLQHAGLLEFTDLELAFMQNRKQIRHDIIIRDLTRHVANEDDWFTSLEMSVDARKLVEACK